MNPMQSPNTGVGGKDFGSKEKAVCDEWLVGRWVECSAPNHDGQYCVFEVNKKKNTAKIQRPDEFKPHWVNVRHLTYA
jgi:hypothetical protein